MWNYPEAFLDVSSRTSVAKVHEGSDKINLRRGRPCWDKYSNLFELAEARRGLMVIFEIFVKTKRRRSDPVLWQKPLHQKKCQKGKVTRQTTPQKNSITQQLRIISAFEYCESF